MLTQLGTILLVEDNGPDAVLLQEMLARDGNRRPEIHWAHSLREALELLAHERYDAILADLSLPDSHGLDTIRQVAAAAAGTPILVITGSTDEQTATQAVRCGAEDYLVKGETDARSITRAIQYAIDRKHAAERLHKEIQRANILLRLHEQSPRLTEKELYAFAIDHAVRLTDSVIGFLHIISDDQKRVLLSTWNCEAMRNCQSPEKMEYLVEDAGNWLDSGRLKRPVVYNDYSRSPNRKGLPKGHVGLHRFMSIPIVDEGEVRMVFGVGNKAEPYEDHDVVQLQLVANELYNIVRQRRMDAANRESEEKYRSIFDQSPIAIEFYDAAGALVVVNQACREMFGIVDSDEVRGFELFDDPNLSEQAKAELRQGRSIHMESEFDFERVKMLGRFRTTKSGVIALDWRITPLSRENGAVFAYIAQIQDVSERNRAEESRQRMQAHLAHVARLSNMGEMAAGIAHELGQPLYAILNYAKAGRNLLAREPLDVAGLTECAGKIAEIASSAGSIGRRLRAFARQAEQERSACDVHEVVREAIALVAFDARQGKVGIETDFSPNRAVVWASRVEIQQVLVNLLKNAFEVMEQSPLSARRVVVRTVADEGIVKVEVTDRGPGLPPADKIRIFDAFVTTKPKGLGMGLTISATIIENYGGKIWAAANPEGGACFQFQLPLHRGGNSHAN